MKKKIYETPSMEVIDMKPNQQLLLIVSGEDDVGSGGGSATEPRASFFDDPAWDELLDE